MARLAAAIAVLALCGAALPACNAPPMAAASGPRRVPTAGGLSVAVPAGWTARDAGRGLTLTRESPYAGGYPTITVAVLDGPDGAGPGGGTEWTWGAWTFEHRYRRWSGPRGRGFRLEGTGRGPELRLRFEAAVWDDADRIDRTFFEQEIWPIVLSAQPEP